MPDYNKLEVPDDSRLALASSPLAYLDRWKAPVLVIHGDDDRNVSFAETVTPEEFAGGLMRAKGEYEAILATLHPTSVSDSATCLPGRPVRTSSRRSTMLSRASSSMATAFRRH